MTARNWLVRLALRRPVAVTWAMVVSTLVIVVLAAAPSLWPDRFSVLNPLVVDTDPENMLAEDAPVRVFHDQRKATFSLRDVVVVGVVNERDPNGVFNPTSLGRVYDLARFAQGLTWQEGETRRGVVAVDVIAPSTVDAIEQAGLGAVSFEWLMPEKPRTAAEAAAVRDKARRVPMYEGTLLGEDPSVVALYLPITDKAISYRVRAALLDYTAAWTDEQVMITGLPVAEDTFGVEMFIQMAISAPAAMGVIFILLWVFFRKLSLITAPMVVAMAAALSTMGLLVVTGNTVHIMSSMIPIFIMPIAVLDAVHILSEFYDRYQRHRDRRQTLVAVMNTLYAPMLFTTLTTMAGFASLALTPIPPVQVFGVFIAIGVGLAWLWTITFVPAFILFIPEHKLAGFGLVADAHDTGGRLGRVLQRIGRFSHRRARLVLLGMILAIAVAGVGISRIVVNDNPIKWFEADHPIRQADRVLNRALGGTYMAYLSLSPVATVDATDSAGELAAALRARGDALGDLPGAAAVFDDLAARVATLAGQGRAAVLARAAQWAETGLSAADDDSYDAWDAAALLIDATRQEQEIFKRPDVLRWMAALQDTLAANPLVGKTTGLPDVVKTVHRELFLGDAAAFRIPDSAAAVGQTLITFQGSHRPQDLWKMVTPDYRDAVLWVQLKSGDNVDMSAVVEATAAFMADNPPPVALEADWFGLTYINVVWQQQMVTGMLKALLGSFVVVLVMMSVLFRSVWWGLLSMVPLSVTIGLIYGVIGLVGKDYDMPVAVLSALSLGLAIDYAIHFLARSREAVAAAGDWARAVPKVFGEPARAISRNAIVLGLGFTPLLFAPLVPYKTVGILIASILLAAGLATLVLLPALITLGASKLFRPAAPGDTTKEDQANVVA